MDFRKADQDYIWHPCSQMKDYETFPSVMAVKGRGSWIYDENGKGYLDVISSWWCNLLGHCNPRINQAVKDQMDKMEHVIFANFTHEPVLELCSRLKKLVPEGLAKFFFVDNGSTSVECALKISFQYHMQTGQPQRKKFMTLAGGYHGETLGALSLGGMDFYRTMYQPLLMDQVIHVEGPDCYRCPYGKHRDSCDAECFEKTKAAFAKYGETTAGFFLEPMVQGAAGMRMYSPAYLKKLRAICTEYGVHMIADEIAAGYGRTGKMFACEHAGVTPDMMCVSKGLTGGYLPMAITITTDEIYDGFYDDFSAKKAFVHSNTYSGSPLGCAAAVEVLKILEEEQVIKTSAQNGQYLKKRLEEELAEHPNVGEIRCLGMINAIELVKNRETKEAFSPDRRTGYEIYKKAMEKGLMLRPMGDIPYFNPPLTMTREELDVAVIKAVEAIRDILEPN